MGDTTESPRDVKYTKRRFGPIFFIVCGAAICYGAISDYVKNGSDSIDYSFNEGVVYNEAKSLFGSMINKDTLLVTDDNIKIMHRNQFLGKRVETLPYSSIKEIVFGNAIGGYKVEILKASKNFGTDTYTFHLNQKDTFKKLTDNLKAKSQNRCPITEEL